MRAATGVACFCAGLALAFAANSAAHASVVNRYTYDALGRVTSYTHCTNTVCDQTISYSYDGAGNRTQTALSNQNSNPVAVADNIGMWPGVGVTFDPRVNDSDPYDLPLKIVSVTQPAHGTATVAADGTSITYTANAGATTDAFSYTVTDSRGGTASANVSATIGLYVTYLLVGGGGGGGSGQYYPATGRGGGGGGGGFLQATSFIGPGSYPVVVGAGGSGIGNGYVGINGGDTTFAGVAAKGGGGGGGAGGAGTPDDTSGQSGGSGGGGATNSSGGAATSGGLGTSGQGYSGASGPGGGGGAGAVASNTSGGVGASSSISGATVTYAKGGDAGPNSNTTGGSGVNLGDGGQGGGGGAPSGSGHSGVVIVSYPTGSATMTGGTVTTSGGYTIRTFTSSGTLVLSSP